MTEKPDWWPKNPYPASIFRTDLEHATDAIKGKITGMEMTAFSGAWGRHVWDLAADAIWERMQEAEEFKSLSDGQRGENDIDSRNR
jgi:hypothetical protein